MTKNENINIAVNAVILTIKDRNLMVYLDTRDSEPYKNLLELPGGLLHSQETAESTLDRKLINITGINGHFFRQFHTFTSPKRDPRNRIVAIGFIALLSYDKVTDSEHYHQINHLPKLAFDHREIINKALEYLRQNLNTDFISHIVPEYFPLNDLQAIYELIGMQKLDNRNFRKKMLSSGLIKKVKYVQQNVNHRPASLYQFVKSKI